MWMSLIFRYSMGPVLLLIAVCCLGLSGCSQMADESAASPEAMPRESADTNGAMIAETSDPLEDYPPPSSIAARFEPDRREFEPQPVPYVSGVRPADSPPPDLPLSPRPTGAEPRIVSDSAPSAPPSERMMLSAPLAAMDSSWEEYPLEIPEGESLLEETFPEESPFDSADLTEAGPASPMSSEPDRDHAEVAASETMSTDPDYERVTVFYGTDRKAEIVSVSDPRPHEKWLYATVVSAAMALLCVIVAFRRAGRMMVAAATLSLMATVVLGAITVAARVQSATMAAGPERIYGPDRGTLQVGTCQVSIPKSHKVGEVETPSIFKFEFVENPRKHVVLLSVDQQPEESFFADLKRRVDGSRRKEAFVFIHGYNVTFEEAAQRTAQLTHDLEFDGAPIFYSWPSQGGLLRYTIDETNAAWTVPNMKHFLLAVAQRSEADSVHLIAHSMGNRPLTAALQALANEFPDGRHLFREVVLTAPDIDAEVFRRDIAPAIIRTADRVTLYASSNDKALDASKQFHGYPRAGDSGENLVIVAGVDTVDVSAIDCSLIGHSYYGSNDTVVADMIDLLVASKPPDFRRWLKPARFGQDRYWVFLTDPARDGTADAGAFPSRR